MFEEKDEINDPIQWLNNIFKYFLYYLKESFIYDIKILTNNTCKKTRKKYCLESKQDSYTYLISKTLKFWIPIPFIFDIYLEKYKNDISKFYKDQCILAKEIVFFHTDELKIFLIQDDQKNYLTNLMDEINNTIKEMLSSVILLSDEHRINIINKSLKDIFTIGHSFMNQYKSFINNHNKAYSQFEDIIDKELSNKFGKPNVIIKYKEELRELRYKSKKMLSNLLKEKDIDYNINELIDVDIIDDDNNNNTATTNHYKNDIDIALDIVKNLLHNEDNDTIRYIESEVNNFNSKWENIIGYHYEKIVILNEEYDKSITNFSSLILKKYEKLINDIENKTKTKILEINNNIDYKETMYKEKLNTLMEKLNKYKTNMSLNINSKYSSSTIQKMIDRQRSRVTEYLNNIEKILNINNIYIKMYIFKNNLLFFKKLWEMIFLKNKRYRIT